MNPLVSICLATFNPNMEFLKHQLSSINAQTYGNVELLVVDDCSKDPDEVFALITEMVQDIPFKLHRNVKNLGSTKTFERLTELANGDFIAYCDQDDIWEADKITTLLGLMHPCAELSYSDLSVIDEKGNITHSSFRKKRRRVKHIAGKELHSFFIRRNCITGCTMLIRSAAANAALPFPRAYQHDHWLALNASVRGEIAYCERPLVRYRLHGNNVIGAAKLADATDKRDYLTQRLYHEQLKYDAALGAFPANAEVRRSLDFYNEYLTSRASFFKKRSFKTFIGFCKGFRTDPALFALELVIAVFPVSWGRRLIAFLKKH